MTTPKRPAKKTTRAPRPKSVSKPKAAKPTPARPPKRAVAPPKRTTQADDPVHVRAAADDRGPPPPVVAQIRELEAQLDRLIDEASRRDVSELDDELDEDDADVMAETQEAPVEPRPDPLLYPEVTRDATELLAQRGFAAAPASTSTAYGLGLDRPSTASLGRDEATVFDTARELLSTDFYLRKWGRLAMRGRSEEVDEFGFDPIYEEKARAVLDFLYAKYFRVEATGIERVPARGRCLLIANHSGTLPLDGVMLKTAIKLEHPEPRDLRWLTEDFIAHMPFLGSTMNRLGAVRACQENAERLLVKEELVAVFPEGVKGISKLFSERYRLQRFGRGGFIKLCLRTKTPIVPVAIVGAEETNPLLFRVEYLAKALGLPYVPVTPTFPALGPLGLIPAPTKWQIHFGEPIDFSGHGRDAADDEIVVGKLAERVRATIQGMLDRAIGTRKSVFFG